MVLLNSRLPRPRKTLIWFVFAVLLALFAGLKKQPETALYIGPFRAVDGDTLTIDGERLRLRGLDAPERRQQCGKGKAVWPCGLRATAELKARLEHATCTARGRDKYRRRLVTCRFAGGDLGADLVREGHAVAYGNYRAEEADARRARRGIWSGPFATPEAWRKQHRPRAAASDGWLDWIDPGGR